MQSLLHKKEQAFNALFEKKEKEFERLKSFQEKQLESINESQQLEANDIIENPAENQMREVRIENKSIDKLQEQVDYLAGFEFERPLNTISSGTLILTSQGNYIVAVPDLNFKVEGESFSGISTESPLFKALEGKKEGDVVTFNNQKIKIEGVA